MSPPALPLRPCLLDARLLGVERVHVVTMQAVSGAGLPGVPSLRAIDNLVPFIPGEEDKLETESRKILGRLDGEFRAVQGRARMGRGAHQGARGEADLVIGAVLIPGAAAPKLVHRAQLSLMKRGAVVVDVAIDQGGCFETSKPTTHQEPTYVVDEVVHYCVANMPGAVARTSTFALTNATLPYVIRLANLGVEAALRADKHLREGLNVHAGHVTYEAVARDLGYEYVPFEKSFGA